MAEFEYYDRFPSGANAKGDQRAQAELNAPAAGRRPRRAAAAVAADVVMATALEEESDEDWDGDDPSTRRGAKRRGGGRGPYGGRGAGGAPGNTYANAHATFNGVGCSDYDGDVPGSRKRRATAQALPLEAQLQFQQQQQQQLHHQRQQLQRFTAELTTQQRLVVAQGGRGGYNDNHHEHHNDNHNNQTQHQLQRLQQQQQQQQQQQLQPLRPTLDLAQPQQQEHQLLGVTTRTGIADIRGTGLMNGGGGGVGTIGGTPGLSASAAAAAAGLQNPNLAAAYAYIYATTAAAAASSAGAAAAAGGGGGVGLSQQSLYGMQSSGGLAAGLTAGSAGGGGGSLLSGIGGAAICGGGGLQALHDFQLQQALQQSGRPGPQAPQLHQLQHLQQQHQQLQQPQHQQHHHQQNQHDHHNYQQQRQQQNQHQALQVASLGGLLAAGGLSGLSGGGPGGGGGSGGSSAGGVLGSGGLLASMAARAATGAGASASASAATATGLLPPDGAGVAAAAVAAPSRKRVGRPPGSGAAAAAAAANGGVPGKGSKFFPKESQEEVRRFLVLLQNPDVKIQISTTARQVARQLEGQLRQLVSPGVRLDWSGPISRLEQATYRAVEDLCGDLQDHLDAAIQAELSAASTGGAGVGAQRLLRTGSGSGLETGDGGGAAVVAAAAPAANPRRLRQLSAMKAAFLSSLQEALDDIVRTRMETAKQEYSGRMAELVASLPPELAGIPESVPGMRLPDAVLANREPYFSVPEWRKTPFQPRPYETLTSYAIRSTISEECDVLRAKLRTRRPDGAAEHFTLEHGKELGLAECKQKESALAAAVRSRQALVMGRHVVEVDCWGMDCYTRRNMFDAVQESGAFKHCRTAGSRAITPEPDGSETAADVASGGGGGSGAPAVWADASAKAKLEEVKTELRVKTEIVEELAPQRTPTPTPTPPPLPPSQHPPSQQQQAQGGLDEGDATRDDEAIAAALAADEAEAAGASRGGGGRGRGGRGGRGRRGAAAADKGGGGGGGGAGAAGVQAALPPPPPPCDPKEAEAINDWIDRHVLCTAIALGADGWNLLRILEDVQARSRERGDRPCNRAAAAVMARLRQIGWAYFRLHPKGRGVVCRVPEGLPAFTFVEEYLGELHSPWRWFEIQDAIKKLTQQELPDFYNITLERPRDDPDGYDVLFVEAAFMASFASRMSHSCTPNCAAVVVSVNGRLTIAMYTKRRVEPGEELTFDYSSVTESEKEFRAAICLCGTRTCRGSYLYYSGSTAFTQVMEQRHNFLHRQAILLRASIEPVNEEDHRRLRKHSLGPTSLGDGTSGNNKAPDWLVKWAALVLEYVEAERRELPGVLLDLPPHLGRFTNESAQIEAEAIVQNRVQQIAITLDKVKMVLRQPGQLQTAPMRPLTDAEVVAFLWSGANSIAKRILKSAARCLAPSASSSSTAIIPICARLASLWSLNGPTGNGSGGCGGSAAANIRGAGDGGSDEDSDGGAEARAVVPARGRGRWGAIPPPGGDEEDARVAALLPGRFLEFAGGPDGTRAPRLARVLRLMAKKASTPSEARDLLLELESLLRLIDLEEGAGEHTAAADMLHLYGSTMTWFTAERGYTGFASPPIELHEEMVKLHRVKLAGSSGGGGGGGGSRTAGAGSGRGGGRRGGRSGRIAGSASAAAVDSPDFIRTSQVFSSDESEAPPDDDDDSDCGGGGRAGRGGRGGRGGGRGGRGRGRWGGRAGRGSEGGGRRSAATAAAVGSLSQRAAEAAAAAEAAEAAALAEAEAAAFPGAPRDLADAPASTTTPVAELNGDGPVEDGRDAAGLAAITHAPCTTAEPSDSAAAGTAGDGADALAAAGDGDAGGGTVAGITSPRRKPPAATVRLADPSVLCKRYGPWFMWGQLSGWYKQTVYDPTASLSAERRGTLSLPDIESCYASKKRYTAKDRTAVLRHLESCPDAQWKTSLPFSFRNDAKIYGSPMFDQVYLEATGSPHLNPMPAVLQHLNSVQLPGGGGARHGR